jgi:hypothetical protein
MRLIKPLILKTVKLLVIFYCAMYRATPDVVKDLMLNGYVPSWCTACYRKGRTGEHFMKIAKAGNIHSFCHPNSILSLQVGAGIGLNQLPSERQIYSGFTSGGHMSLSAANAEFPPHPLFLSSGVSQGLWDD